MAEYRVVRRDTDYYVQKKRLGFLWMNVGSIYGYWSQERAISVAKQKKRDSVAGKEILWESD